MHLSLSRTRARRALRPSLQAIEPRTLLSGFSPTALEQYFLGLLNDARFNPGAYGESIGIDLSGVAPSQPLAMNPLLVESARLHSQDMIAQGYFAHVSPQGADPGARIVATGFAANGWAESIESNTEPSQYGGSFAANFAAWDAGFSLSALIVDQGVPSLGHRVMLLDIGGQDQAMRQVGIGIASQDSSPGPPYNYRKTDTTIDLAATAGTGPYLTGVVFNDAAGDGEYEPGEGLGGVTISVAGVGSTTTMDAGGYSIALSPGTYTVTASGGGLAEAITRTVVVGDQNAQLDFDANPNGTNLGAAASGAAGGTLGTFKAIAAGDTASSYRARIDWGDGNATFATLSQNPDGTFSVQGAELYDRPGVYAVRVLVTHLSDGETLAINATAFVGSTPPAGGQGGSGSGSGSSYQISTGSGSSSQVGAASGTVAAAHGRHRKTHPKPAHPKPAHPKPAHRVGALIHAVGRKPVGRRAAQRAHHVGLAIPPHVATGSLVVPRFS